MSLSTTYALLAFLIGCIAAAALIDWRWLPREDASAEERRRLNALSAAGDQQLQEMR